MFLLQFSKIVQITYYFVMRSLPWRKCLKRGCKTNRTKEQTERTCAKKNQHINTGHRWETNKNKRRNNKGGRKTGKKHFFIYFPVFFINVFLLYFCCFSFLAMFFFSGSLFPQFDSVCILKLRMVLQQIGPGFSSRCSAWSCNMPMSCTCFSWSLGHSFNGGKLCSIWKSQLGPVWLSAEGLQTDFFF